MNYRKINIVFVLFSTLVFSACSPAKKAMKSKHSLTEANYRDNSALFIEGKRKEFSGDTEGAVAQFRKVIDADPQNHAASYELAKIYVDARGGDDVRDLMSAAQAEKWGRLSVESAPENKWYALNLVKLYCVNGDEKKAGTAGKKFLAISKNDINNYYRLYNVYAKCSDYRNALMVLEELDKNFGFNEAFALKRKELYYRNGDYGKAESEMKNLLKHFPQKKEYYGMTADILMAEGKSRKAVEYYKKITELDPDDGKVRIVLASYYNSTGDRKRSYEELKKAFESPTLDVDEKVKMMMKLYRITSANPGDSLLWRQADTLLDILTRVNGGNAKVLAMQGDYLSRDKKWRAARSAYEKVIALDSTKYPVWEQLILICNEQQDYEAMQNYTERALVLFPQYSIVYYFNAVADYRLADYKEAEAVLNLGLSFVYKKQQKLEFYTLMGIVRDSLHKYKSAEIAYENVMIEDANYAPGLKAYALHLLITGEDLEKAEAFAKKALELNYNSAEYMYAYARVLYRRGKYDEAQRWALKALAIDDKDKKINILTGNILWKKGDKDGARKYWKKGGKK